MCSRCESELEKKFHEAWLKHPASKELSLIPQYIIDQHRVDFALVQYQIAIEADSKEFHSSDEARKKDQERDDILRAKGWKLIHLYGPDIYWKPNATVEITVFMIQNMFDQFVPARKLLPNIEDTVVSKQSASYHSNLAVQLAVSNVVFCFLLVPIFVYESISGIQMIHTANDEKIGIVVLFCTLLMPVVFRLIHWLTGPNKKGEK